MKSDFFIDRPVFSTVLSIVIVIVGLLGLVLLPVDQYPRIVPPVVKVSASYPGASAQTVTQAVATPIEQELNGTPGMLYMESTSSNSGGFSATVTFDIDTDADLAAVEIQNRVKQAEARLPAEVIQNGISVEKQASSRLMTITLLSNDPKFDEIYLSNYATLNVLDMLRRVKGVGSVSNVGSRYYAMQIWVQPDRLANLGLTVQDLQKALKDQNRESAAGVLGQQPITDLDVTIPITARGRLSSVREFEEIVIRANPDGSLIRLRDVARISLEASSYSTESGINGGNAAVMNINMLPGANAMEVAHSVRETMEEISRSFPEGISYKIPFDMTSYISQSIKEVYHTLFEALLTGDPRGLPLAAKLARDAHPDDRRADLADRYVRRDAGFRILAQHDDPAGTYPRHRHRRGRRHRGRRSRGTHDGRRGTLPVRSHEESHERTGQRHRRHVAGAVRRVRSRELPLGHHRPALPPVHHHHRRFGADLDVRGPDAFAGPLRPDPAPRSGQEEKPPFPPHQHLAGQRNEILRTDDPRRRAPFETHAGALRADARGAVGAQPDRTPELHAAGGPGLFHRRTGTSGRGHARTYAPRDGPRYGVPDVARRGGIRAQRHRIEPPRGHQPVAQPADGDPQTVGGAQKFGHPPADEQHPRGDAPLSRKQGLPLDAARHSGDWVPRAVSKWCSKPAATPRTATSSGPWTRCCTTLRSARS